MSLLPFFYDQFYRPPCLFDQHFALGISPEDLITPTFGNFRNQFYLRPWKIDIQDSGSTMKDEKDKFEVMLDVKQFKPEEISVKTTNGEIIIEGKHEEKQDEHGFVSRQFTRKYLLPKDCDCKQVTSHLTSDGVLIITANKNKEIKCEPMKVPIKLEDANTSLTCKTGNQTKETNEVNELCVKESKEKDLLNVKESTCMKDKSIIDGKQSDFKETKCDVSKEVIKSVETSSTQETIKEESTDMSTTEMLSKIDETLKTIKGDLKTEKSTRDDRCSLLNPDGTLKFSAGTMMDATKSEFSSSSIEMSSKEASTFASMTMSMDMKSSTEKSEFISDKIISELKQAAENF